MKKFMLNFVVILLVLISTPTPSETFNHRSKRFLTFVRRNSAVLQLICGVGLPVNLELESVTMGYVFKADFYFPMNASDFWSFAEPFDVSNSNYPVVGRSEHEIENEGSGYDDDQRERLERSMSEADVVESGTIRNDIEDSNLGNDGATTRWLVYKGLAAIAENHGLEGRSCVLRSICESAHVPFDHSNGILGELFHIIMSPSLTKDEIVHHEDNEYLHAEQLGKEGAPCDRVFNECKLSLLDQFSGIYSSLSN